MKGLIIFYINFPAVESDQRQGIDFLKQINKDVFDKILNETDYEVMIFPTVKEACRVEKIDFSRPFPIFSSGGIPRPKKKPRTEEQT